MLFLIAESKTMASHCERWSDDDWLKFAPVTQLEADEIMNSLRGKSASELASALKASDAMGMRLKQWIYDFPLQNSALIAIESFTGVVFKALDFSNLSQKDRSFASDHVRILSSLYGYLRPDNLVKPYRFDYKTRLAPENKAFSSYWKREVTRLIVSDLDREAGKEKVVVDLLPRDAAAMVDWGVVERNATVVRIDFRDIKDGGDVATPHSGRLKMLRGKFLREALLNNAETICELKTMNSPDFLFSSELSTETCLTYLT